MRGWLFANGIDGMQRRRRQAQAVARARRQEGGCSQEQRQQERHQERQQESRKEGHQERQQLDKGRRSHPRPFWRSIGTAFPPLRGAVLQDAELQNATGGEQVTQAVCKQVEVIAAAAMESLTNGLQSALARSNAVLESALHRNGRMQRRKGSSRATLQSYSSSIRKLTSSSTRVHLPTMQLACTRRSRRATLA